MQDDSRLALADQVWQALPAHQRTTQMSITLFQADYEQLCELLQAYGDTLLEHESRFTAHDYRLQRLEQQAMVQYSPAPPPVYQPVQRSYYAPEIDLRGMTAVTVVFLFATSFLLLVGAAMRLQAPPQQTYTIQRGI
jgi:hypothetical protein